MTAGLRKAVFPVAGLGTRFLPATKANPKEMLPVVDKPIIQYAVEEAVAAGITELIFITGRTKRAIEDHFDRAVELEATLEAKRKTAELEGLRAIIPDGVSCVYIRQAEPRGLGHAVLCARAVVGEEAFAVVLPDDLIDDGGRGCLAQMTAIFESDPSSLVAVETVPREDTDKYGIVSTKGGNGRAVEMTGILEKPAPDKAPSTLAVVGRYILTPGIFAELEATGVGAGGEIQLTDAIARLLQKEPVNAFRFEGRRYDCGSKLGFLEATVAMGLKHPEIGEAFRALLADYRD
ncbi:MAG TPA: UTP--glucose-1-phosphate uridylyltransferase GalU [Gammaproteobacteria bacterium]|nr:UTP--glucose-1-phosphate uridylyltransferase GalU [Gammaproteobacteria bacterium]